MAHYQVTWYVASYASEEYGLWWDCESIDNQAYTYTHTYTLSHTPLLYEYLGL